jgi:hypothetical protein
MPKQAGASDPLRDPLRDRKAQQKGGKVQATDFCNGQVTLLLSQSETIFLANLVGDVPPKGDYIIEHVTIHAVLETACIALNALRQMDEDSHAHRINTKKGGKKP